MTQDKVQTSQRVPLIGPAIQKERKRRKLTLEQLSGRSGVSKSMLSQVERGEANPTFAVVWSLTQALEIDFSDLIGGAAAARDEGQISVTPALNTPEIRSGDGSCRLKILSASRFAGLTEWYDVEIDPGSTLESDPHAPGTFESFTVLAGSFVVRSGDSSSPLGLGDTARYPADVMHSISNTGNGLARGLLVVLYR